MLVLGFDYDSSESLRAYYTLGIAWGLCHFASQSKGSDLRAIGTRPVSPGERSAPRSFHLLK